MLPFTTKRFSEMLSFICLVPVSYGFSFSNELAEVQALGHLTNPPIIRLDDTTMGVTNVAPGELKAIYYDALDYTGSPTRVYAWLGIPAGATPGAPVPGVVLVHGGGGTAFRTWVEAWTNRGYAAISIAVEGQTDWKNDPPSIGTGWHKHNMAGPSRVGIYGDSGVDIINQWMYHAVADTVLANSLLRSLPEVNADKVGLTGISWGGVIASTVMGIDTRFAFSMPQYGCGHLYDAENQYGSSLKNNDLYKEVWDPMVWLSYAAMPALWLSWPRDAHFPMDSLAYSYHAASGQRMVSLIPDFGHGHKWSNEDTYAFADSIISNGTPWCIQDSLSFDGGTAVVQFTSSRVLDLAQLISTAGSGFTGDLTWRTNAAVLVSHGGGSWTASAEVPPDTTGWFLNVLDDALVASSDYQENISLYLAPTNGLEIDHPLPGDLSTGTVDAAFTAPTNVQITNIVVHSQSHPGAFTALQPLPWVLGIHTPLTSSFPIEFDNTTAGLTNGQSATGLVSVVWRELDGSSDHTNLPIRAAAKFSANAFYHEWASSNQLDIINVNTAAHLNTVRTSVASRLRRDDEGFRKGAVSAWTVTNGVLGNRSLDNSAVAEGALGRMVDCSAFSNLNSSLLSLEFDYTTADAAETLYVHLWGYVDVSSVSNTMTMNLAAPDGSAWESAGGAMIPYNLGQPDGAFSVPAGHYTHAAATLTGSAGSHVYSNRFDLTSFVTAPNTVADYDYLVLGFTRQIGGTSTPEVKIRNVILSAVGGDTMLEFVQALPANDMMADPDSDRWINLLEYALAGNPNQEGDAGILPVLERVPGGHSINYIYPRRIDAGIRGLRYTVQTDSNLVEAAWSGDGFAETGTGIINDEFERVTNSIDDRSATLIRLRIGFEE